MTKKVKEKECVILFRYVKFQLRKLDNNDKKTKILSFNFNRKTISSQHTSDILFRIRHEKS